MIGNQNERTSPDRNVRLVLSRLRPRRWHPGILCLRNLVNRGSRPWANWQEESDQSQPLSPVFKLRCFSHEPAPLSSTHDIFVACETQGIVEALD